MPSKTKKQARFMAACAHGAGYASCPPKKISKEFNQADKGTKMLKHTGDEGSASHKRHKGNRHGY